MSSLKIEHLSVDYAGQRALTNVSFALPAGQVAAIVGPSGCGKSTLLKAVAGLIPSRGELCLDGNPLDPKGQKIGFMPQDYGLLPWQTARDNILLPWRIRHEQAAVDSARFDYLLKKLGLTDLLMRYPRELSGGERQRVGLARTFLFAPDILLMDEPFSALDAITREAMQEIFLALWHETAMTTLLVTHYVEEALYLSHRILLMGWGGKLCLSLNNPAFGVHDLADKPEYLALGRLIKNRIKEMGARP